MPDRPMLVLGATGGQGGAVVDALLARAAAVRALVRDPRTGSAQRLADRGVEVVAGSLNNEESLAAAMRAVAGVFAMTTPFEDGVRAEVEQGRTILAATHRARVPHLVFSSVAGANQHSGVPHFDSKAAIESELIAGEVAQMAHALGAALGHPVRHQRTPLEAIGSPDMRAMWEFLNGSGYQVDLPALHAAHPEISWTRFDTWATHTFGATP